MEKSYRTTNDIEYIKSFLSFNKQYYKDYLDYEVPKHLKEEQDAINSLIEFLESRLETLECFKKDGMQYNAYNDSWSFI